MRMGYLLLMAVLQCLMIETSTAAIMNSEGADLEVIFNPEGAAGQVIVRDFECRQCLPAGEPRTYILDRNVEVKDRGKAATFNELLLWHRFPASYQYDTDSNRILRINRQQR